MSAIRAALILAAAAAAAAAAGCTALEKPLACNVGRPALLATLFFGRAMPGGGGISDAAWAAFLAADVTPRFPDGLTVLDGYGQWRASGTERIGREASTVVVIAAAPDGATLARLDEIRAAYRIAFRQQSVGLVTQTVCASF